MSKEISNDAFGDRMKSYEFPSTSRYAMRGNPLIARLDGRAFHTFTKGLARPYDDRFTYMMRDITTYLVDQFSAKVGYTQSDEITLVWRVPVDGSSQYPFAGRFQKLDSILAGTASAYLGKILSEYLPEKKDAIPVFDCRTFSVPSLTEAYNTLLWRQQDATKNAISMAAQSQYSHKELQNKNSSEMQEMLFQKGINFNEYPYFFKRGTFVRRVRRFKALTDAELQRIPEQHRPTGLIERSILEVVDIWLSKQENNGVDVLFNDAPIATKQ